MTDVKMLLTVPISLDGLRTETWHAGTVQRAPEDLLLILIDLGAVEIIENKALSGAPENKRRRK